MPIRARLGAVLTSAEKRLAIRELAAAGVSQLEIARRFHIGRKGVRLALDDKPHRQYHCGWCGENGHVASSCPDAPQVAGKGGCARCGLRSVPVASNPTGEHECLPARAEAFLGRKGEQEWP